MSIGFNVGFNGYFLQRETVGKGTLYFQYPLLFSVRGHFEGDHFGFAIGALAGLDISSLTGKNGGYFIGGLDATF